MPSLRAHGIRRHRASLFRENGASADQRTASLGHATIEQTNECANAADLQEIVTEMPNTNPVPNRPEEEIK